jgi:hypothetical protein
MYSYIGKAVIISWKIKFINFGRNYFVDSASREVKEQHPLPLIELDTTKPIHSIWFSKEPRLTRQSSYSLQDEPISL